MKEIEIIIDKNGDITIDLVGWKGDGCAQIAEALSRALGKTIQIDKKCEFYETQPVSTDQQQQLHL